MKRNYPFSSEENKNCDNKQPSSTSSSSSEQNSIPDSPAQNSVRNQTNDPQRTETTTMPSATSTQSFPWLSTSFNRGSEMFAPDSSQNPFMISFGRNCPWPDNRLFGMPLQDPNMTVNSTGMPFKRSEDSVSAANLNRKENEVSGSSKDSRVSGRSPSPLPMFTPEEVDRVNEMLKEKNTLRQGLKILTGWLKKGVCTKINNNDFTDMVKYAHNQVWRLMSEKTEIKEDFNEEKREISKSFNSIGSQFEEICNVLETSKKQQVWDQLTKPQRKQISNWIEEVKQLKLVLTNKSDDDDEDVNDDDIHRSPDSSQDHEKAELKKEYQKLKEQLDNLQQQVQVKESEYENIQREKQEKSQEHENSMDNLDERCLGFDASIAKLKKFKMDALASTLKKKNPKNIENPTLRSIPSTSDGRISADGIEIKQQEVFLLTLISTFLYVHPFGASLDYICSYLISFAPYLNTRYLESLLTKFPEVFKEEKRGIGATLTRYWCFIGFKDKNKNPRNFFLH